MTAIEWTSETWNPTTGCDRVSPGCDNCYALTMAKRLKGMGQEKYQRDGDPRTSGPGFGLTVHPDTLDAPLSWRKPRKVFVNSMSDLFHAGVSDEFIARVFAVMATTPQHTYQVLTKRHGRMRSLIGDRDGDFQCLVGQWRYRHGEAVPTEIPPADQDDPSWGWPLPNVHLGVSVEDQKRADLRIPALLDTPAAVRFLSCEPLLGPVGLARFLRPARCSQCGQGWEAWACGPTHALLAHDPGLHWVIVGGESGSGARPINVEWVRSLVEQCGAASIPVFVKQLGSVWAQASGWGGKGGLPEQWPSDLRVRQFPAATADAA